MHSEHISVALQKKLFDKSNNINIDIFYAILEINIHLIMKMFINEINLSEIIKKIDLQDLYNLGIFILSRAIIEFNNDENNTEDFYYDTISLFFKENLYEYLNNNSSEEYDKEKIIKWINIGNRLNENLKKTNISKPDLDIILDKDKREFIKKLYSNEYSSKELQEMLKDKNSIIHKTLGAFVNKIENTISDINEDFTNN